MSTGHLVLVVGPSGAGKDSVLNGAKACLGPNSSIVFPRRFVTRLGNAAAEDHISLTEAEFNVALAAGTFALWWRAHGNSYGIGRSIEGDLAAGAVVAINCSREIIAQAAQRFQHVTVVEITAPTDVLVARIVARGRETREQALQRVSRLVPDSPAGVARIRIVNDGPLDAAVSRFCSLLRELHDKAGEADGTRHHHGSQQDSHNGQGSAPGAAGRL